MIHELCILRDCSNHECWHVESDTVPVPPESGDWTVTLKGGHEQVIPMANAEQVVVRSENHDQQDESGTYVWDVNLAMLCGKDEELIVEGAPMVKPALPDSGTWWPFRACDSTYGDAEPKQQFYTRRTCVVNVDVGASSREVA